MPGTWDNELTVTYRQFILAHRLYVCIAVFVVVRKAVPAWTCAVAFLSRSTGIITDECRGCRSGLMNPLDTRIISFLHSC